MNDNSPEPTELKTLEKEISVIEKLLASKHYKKGVVNLHMLDYEKGLNSIQKALEYDPTNSEYRTSFIRNFNEATIRNQDFPKLNPTLDETYQEYMNK